MIKYLHKFKNSILPILYPRHCPICQKLLPYGQQICPTCRDILPFTGSPVCFRCGKPVSNNEQEYCYDCRIFPKSFQAGRALLIYNEISRPPMMDFKYHNRRILSDFFTKEILLQHASILHSWNLDAIIPIPLHKQKKKKRGYNQAALLCKDIALALNLPYYPDFLIRHIDTLPQKQFTPQARLNNLQKAFCLNPSYKKLAHRLSSVLLIDDIYTTGATMETGSRILRQSGIKNVYIYSVCIGISRD